MRVRVHVHVRLFYVLHGSTPAHSYIHTVYMFALPDLAQPMPVMILWTRRCCTLRASVLEVEEEGKKGKKKKKKKKKKKGLSTEQNDLNGWNHWHQGLSTKMQRRVQE